MVGTKDAYFTIQITQNGHACQPSVFMHVKLLTAIHVFAIWTKLENWGVCQTVKYDQDKASKSELASEGNSEVVRDEGFDALSGPANHQTVVLLKICG